MDKKKTLILFIFCFITQLQNVFSQDSDYKIEFKDKKYEWVEGKDSITLFFNILDSSGERVKYVDNLEYLLRIKEDGKEIHEDSREVASVNSGQRIPSDYTFSVLVDLSMPDEGKELIFSSVKTLVESAADSSIFLSFFGKEVSPSYVITKDNYNGFKDQFFQNSEEKYLYGAVYSKLIEFDENEALHMDKITTEGEDIYQCNQDIAKRAASASDLKHNILIVFTGGEKEPDQNNDMDMYDVMAHQEDMSNVVPITHILYYTANREDPDAVTFFQGLCEPKKNYSVIEERRGEYSPTNEIGEIMAMFQTVVDGEAYDYAFKYKVEEERTYSGAVEYVAEWKSVPAGNVVFSIGSEDYHWPKRPKESTDIILIYLYSICITLLTVAFFFFVMKILIPFVQSKAFAVKYYKKYVPEANVSRRICHYCKRDIQAGQRIVVKCNHKIHVACWQQNGYKCAEYGQNCKTGIQPHVEWRELFTMNSFKDCYQTISGILAGFISWVLYDLLGLTMFTGFATSFLNLISSDALKERLIYSDCLTKTNAFLVIGLILGFFISLIFRSNDEYKSKNLIIWLKIIGLSLLTSLIGVLAFALGAYIMVIILTMSDATYIPWYCSLPAYILFSLCISLALTIKSTIPLKSALIGGLCSAIIGFIVLYCSSMISTSQGWINLLLDFIIYGGGLGASLVTVRMLAEKYFLVIQNGIRAGQRIPIHKWMNSIGGGNKVSIGMTGECEIQMNWEKSNKVAKEHVQLYIDYDKQLPFIKPLAAGVEYNSRVELPVGKPAVLSNGDTFKIGDTIFLYEETN